MDFTFTMSLTSATQPIYFQDEGNKMTWIASARAFEYKRNNQKAMLSLPQLTSLIPFFTRAKEEHLKYLARGTANRGNVFTARAEWPKELCLTAECEETGGNAVLRFLVNAGENSCEFSSNDIALMKNNQGKIDRIVVEKLYKENDNDPRYCPPHTENRAGRPEKRPAQDVSQMLGNILRKL